MLFSFGLFGCRNDKTDSDALTSKIALLEDKEILLDEKDEYLRKKENELDERQVELDERNQKLEEAIAMEDETSNNSQSETNSEIIQENEPIEKAESDDRDIFYERGYAVYYNEYGDMIDAETVYMVLEKHPMYDEKNTEELLGHISNFYEPGMTKNDLYESIYWGTEYSETVIEKAVDIYWLENVE